MFHTRVIYIYVLLLLIVNLPSKFLDITLANEKIKLEKNYFMYPHHKLSEIEEMLLNQLKRHKYDITTYINLAWLYKEMDYYDKAKHMCMNLFRWTSDKDVRLIARIIYEEIRKNELESNYFLFLEDINYALDESGNAKVTAKYRIAVQKQDISSIGFILPYKPNQIKQYSVEGFPVDSIAKPRPEWKDRSSITIYFSKKMLENKEYYISINYTLIDCAKEIDNISGTRYFSTAFPIKWDYNSIINVSVPEKFSIHHIEPKYKHKRKNNITWMSPKNKFYDSLLRIEFEQMGISLQYGSPTGYYYEYLILNLLCFLGLFCSYFYYSGIPGLKRAITLWILLTAVVIALLHRFVLTYLPFGWINYLKIFPDFAEIPENMRSLIILMFALICFLILPWENAKTRMFNQIFSKFQKSRERGINKAREIFQGIVWLEYIFILAIGYYHLTFIPLTTYSYFSLITFLLIIITFFVVLRRYCIIFDLSTGALLGSFIFWGLIWSLWKYFSTGFFGISIKTRNLISLIFSLTLFCFIIFIFVLANLSQIYRLLKDSKNKSALIVKKILDPFWNFSEDVIGLAIEHDKAFKFLALTGYATLLIFRRFLWITLIPAITIYIFREKLRKIITK